MFKKIALKILALCMMIVAMASQAMASTDYTVPTLDLTNFYALGTILLASGAGVFIFKKVRKLLGF
jgi:hypothetical protein